MDEVLGRFHCAIVHVGINCASPQEAQALSAFAAHAFGISPQRDAPASVFVGPTVELMKQGGRGTHGHLAVATDDLLATRAYLEAQGYPFDDSGNKYDPSGGLILTYLARDFAGFAVHLLQRTPEELTQGSTPQFTADALPSSV